MNKRPPTGTPSGVIVVRGSDYDGHEIVPPYFREDDHDFCVSGVEPLVTPKRLAKISGPGGRTDQLRLALGVSPSDYVR